MPPAPTSPNSLLGIGLGLLVLLASAEAVVYVKINLADNLRANQRLGNISALSSAIPPPSNPAIGYNRVILEPNRFMTNRFVVDRRTSELRTVTAIDRDDVCRELTCCKNLVCETNFTVFIAPNAGTTKVVVTLSFRDENDNRPKVSSENITLPESTSIATLRSLLAATDRDSTVNGVKTYSVLDPTGTFGLFMSAPNRPMLKVLKTLDADDPSRRHFTLTYTATDGGTPALTGRAQLLVRVMDENDNTPIFDTYTRTRWVDENTSIGADVYQFRATDGDVDPDNKRITYHLDTVHSTPVGLAAQRFSLNAVNGSVTVRTRLDYDKASERQFSLVVEARDHGSPGRTATATLTVILRNVNDNDPSIAVTNSQPLEEERATNQQVRTVSVSDPDQTGSPRVSCVLKNSPGFLLRPISQHMFDVVTTKAFDFETTPTANVTIVCTDQEAATPVRRVATKTLNIPVVDINDHGPVFVQKSYSKFLPENKPLNSKVLTVKATDKDSGMFGTVHYSLDSVGKRWFKIDPSSGIISVNATLDRETGASLQFRAMAEDGGRPPKKAIVPVRIQLTDVNDNPPALDGPKAVDVVENAREGTIITKVRFRDPDEGRNGQVVFKLVRDNNISLKYLNLTSDGTVVVIKPVDREVTARMYLDIQARDRGTPVMETTISLIVRVLDLNDNPPKLVSPANRSVLGRGANPSVYANSPFNTTVADLKASDADLRENGTVVYDILSTNATGMFRLDHASGRLYTAWRPPSMPGHGLYQMRLRLTDHGRPPLSSEATLYVVVRPSLTGAGISNIIILVLILVASIAIAAALVMAILWARSRAKRSAITANRSPDYAEYDPAVKKPRSVGDSETISNVELGSALAVDPLADSASTLVRAQKTPSRMSQYTDYVIPYPPMTSSVTSKRDSRSPHSFENSYPTQIRTFGHQSPVGQTFAMENFATVGRPGAASPASYQQRPGAFANAHLLPEMFEDDPRQSELSYDDSGKGGSVDDVGRFVLTQHVPSNMASTGVYPLHHHQHTPHRLSLRGSHPGGPGHLTVGAEATLC